MIHRTGIALAGILAILATTIPTSSAEACWGCGGCRSRCGGCNSGYGYGYSGCGYRGCGYSGCGSSCGGCSSGCGTACASNYATCGTAYGVCYSSCGTYYTEYNCAGARTYHYGRPYASGYAAYRASQPAVNGTPATPTPATMPGTPTPAMPMTRKAPVVQVQPISVESRRPSLFGLFR